MKQGIAKFSKEFITDTGLKEWAGIELPFNEERESGVDALKRAEAIVNEHQNKKSYIVHYGNSAPIQYGPLETIMPSENELIAELIKGMYACTDIEGEDGLITFSKLAAGNRETQNVYDIMLRKLSVNK